MGNQNGLLLGILLMIIILTPLSAAAEEGGSGHYMPGATASFIDGLPVKDGLAVGNFFSYYDGSVNKTTSLPFGGSLSAGITGTVWADSIIALYRTPFKLLGGHYVFGLVVPYVWVDVKGDLQMTGPRGASVQRSVSDTANGFGDVTVYPFMLGWTALNGDLRYDFRFGIYVPTGEYNKGRLANVGKNFWTFEPAVSVSYLSSKIGLELSAYAGMDFNTENKDTNYRSGDQFHLEATVAEHLPLLGGLIGLGVNGFYYQQVSGDSGSGAVLGDFKGRTMGFGPVLSYATKVWKKDLVAELKWLPEMNTENRLSGNYIWFKVVMQF
jgi:hypothetical protein